MYAALLKFCVSQGTPEKAVDIWKAIQRVPPFLARSCKLARPWENP